MEIKKQKKKLMKKLKIINQLILKKLIVIIFKLKNINQSEKLKVINMSQVIHYFMLKKVIIYFHLKPKNIKIQIQKVIINLKITSIIKIKIQKINLMEMRIKLKKITTLLFY